MKKLKIFIFSLLSILIFATNVYAISYKGVIYPSNATNGYFMYYTSANGLVNGPLSTNGTDVTNTGALINTGAITEGGNAVPNSTDNLSFFSATTSLQLAEVIINETGSGSLVLANSPTLITPEIGLAKGTSLDLGTTTLFSSRLITVDTGGVFNINLGSASGDDFTIDETSLVVEGDNGNVGINNATPSEKLDIIGNMKVSGSITQTDGATILARNSASDALTVTQSGSGDVAAFLGGNVGIGTSSPKKFLHIYGTAGKLLTLQPSTDNAESSMIFMGDTTSDLNSEQAQVGYDGNANYFFIKTGGTVVGASTNMVIERITGNFGIGTIAPLSRFDIKSSTVDGTTDGLRVLDSGDSSVFAVASSGMITYNIETITCSSDTGTASVVIRTSFIVTDGGADTNEDTVSLANGTVGDEKVFVYMTETDVGDTANITPATGLGFSKIVFDTPGEGCTMVYTSSGWAIVSNNGGSIS